ncbi:SMP-30/gluconolactonase/LRE family protein [Paenibacillus sp. sptzw28]|uniref:SMP-30/gluconolactonase/LRE family protein n=1 Tax=Paenibacillus sp. sptzw28 TaxID=715179 RepID=UPI002163BCFA|nr:SMP-30/gluconolactonase/LRE family protein [Paenibacillus sp. sptzw28]
MGAKAELGEGPSWDARRKLLYWVDITRFKLHVYNPLTKQDMTFNVGQYIGAVVPRRSGGVVMALQHGFYAFDFETWQMTLLGAVELDKPNNRFNDGKCDAAGRFWAGTMAHDYAPGAGSLYYLDTDCTIKKVIANVTISNGITWSPDNSVMYYIDSPTLKVMSYDFNLATAELSNPRVAAEVGQGEAFPDGMTSDEEGMLWVAVWNGYAVKRLDPGTGRLLETVNVPAKRTTSCVFGGDRLTELYITSARIGLEEDVLANEPNAGGVFVLKTGVRGMPTYAFGG